MKKLFNLLMILCISTSMVYASEVKMPTNTHTQVQNAKMKKQNSFDEKLGLTDAQKQEARVLRQASFEKIKPLVKEIQAKKKEIKQIKNSNTDAQLKEQKITNLEKELNVLEKQAHEIKRQNMKDFENILTGEQKKILKQMKNEGRKNYKKRHLPRKIR